MVGCEMRGGRKEMGSEGVVLTQVNVNNWK